MKKTTRKKLNLEATTIRALSAEQLATSNGGRMVSVGTCTGCRPSYCGDCFSNRPFVCA